MKYNNSPRTSLLPLVIAVSVILGVLIGIKMPGRISHPPLSVKPRTEKLGQILNYIEANYVDSVDRARLVEAAVPVILKELDPHSVYIPAQELTAANEQLQGNFEGIGISFNMLTDTVLIISTIPGGPSEKVGVMAGDKIIYVGDSLIAGRGIAEDNIIGMLKGPRGTEVEIRVLRKGVDDLIRFTITRDKIPIHSVDVAYMVNDKTGFIKINRFSMTTYDEFTDAINELKSKGMESLILDLRGNVGGVMDPSVKISDEFLPGDKLIVYTEGRAREREEYRSTDQGSFLEGELLILIDEWSASASEIVAGAIQDNDRGTIIGRRSFGKGLVQEPIMFNDMSAMRLTVARYYTPTGRSIQKPYENGYDEYIAELNERFMRGEHRIADSIHFENIERFETPGGKILYGGGGIMPDIFVPADTSGLSMYFARVRNNGLIYRYALSYTENNRDKLQQYTKADDMNSYLLKQSLLDKFIRFAAENGVAADPEGIKESREIIDIQIRSYIARNLLDNKGFYPIWKELDTTLKVAIEYLED
ncbi:MAG: S41 family peptidase [Bacteroidales bacterium]|nr:S41 family peptidase [Bacteroidales bacterium]